MRACSLRVTAPVSRPVSFRSRVAVAAPSRAAAIEEPSAVPRQERVAAFMNVVRRESGAVNVLSFTMGVKAQMVPGA